MSAEIKGTATPAAGYVYQTMQGVNVLCDWLDAPTRYTRVRFECDDDDVAPQGLDDIVAGRPDGRFDLWQVKFTASSGKYALDWDWLFAKSGKAGGKSRSNLRKWFDAFEAIDPSRIGDVRLVTNRVPDLAMEFCLAGGRTIDYTLAPDEVRTKVENELNGAANAVRLFDALEVWHSDKGFASLEVQVTQRLRRYGTPEGVQALKYRAVHWSIEKNQPAPDGWITLELLKVTLGVVAPEPLPENFFIPPGYRVPDTAFYVSFVASIEASPSQPIVLTGPPGRGKSTFLSKVCELLHKKDVPFVRHHYYLSSTDRTLDRHTSFAVQESLLAQISTFHSDVKVRDKTLAAALATCADHYKAIGRPFVLVLDGLDHVWRNQGHDKRPLDEIFNQIPPATENLVVVVGTQPVDDAQLPQRLLIEAPRNTWQELPTMSADAVLQYLRKEVAQGRLQMDRKGAPAEEELQAAAAELRVRTNGHPLHVIYAIEELVQSGRTLSKWSVEQLAGDLSHDVKTYYGSLWHLLSASQKDVLRLICEFPFFWPRSAFADIAALANSPLPSVEAVEHLLHRSAAGLKPFHESLVVFVSQTDGYDQRVTQLTPHVEVWLAQAAPNALRVNWLWAVKAKQGRPEELIDGLQRDWVMERLQEGYPTELFENLLAEAEECAVQRALYADAYRLRHLKTRLQNSLSYQLHGADAARLKACIWALAPDSSVIEEAIASRHELSTVDTASLGLALYARGDLPAAKRCGDEAFRRYRGESRFSTGNRGFDARDRQVYLAKAFSVLDVVGTKPAWAIELVANSHPSIVWKFLDALVDKADLRSLVGIAMALPDGEPKLMVCDAAVRLALLADADLPAWAEFSQLTCGVLIGCLAAMTAREIEIWVRPFDVDWLTGAYEERQDSLTRLSHDWFFGAVRLALTTKGESFCLSRGPTFPDRENVSDYLNHLGEMGLELGRRWAAREPVSFSYIYEGFAGVSFPGYQNYQRGQGAADFRSTLHTIAFDVLLLSSVFGRSPQLSPEEMQRIIGLSWFDSDQFRSQYVSGGVKALSDDAAAVFVQSQLATLDADVNEETGVRMRAFLELCEMALRHDLKSLATDLCRTTWELVLGYSQRKDPALSDVMDALEYLEHIAPDDTRRLLADIAPQVHNVLSYTDGKGTRQVLVQADRLLASLSRSALAEKYREHTDAGNWYNAEDSLETYLKTNKKDSAILRAVVRTGLQPDAVDSLRKALNLENPEAKKILAEAEDFIGADVGQLAKPTSGGSSLVFKPFPGDVKTYALDELSSLLIDLTEYYGARRDVVRDWYVHWEAQGRGSELIGILESRLLSESCRDNGLNELLDLAFATKLKLEGAAAAFPYIVQAQLFNGGWAGPMYMESREVTEKRLRLVVTKYPRRCDEFYLKSAFSWLSYPKRTRVIPGELMVFFLGLQHREVEAVRFTEAMVRSVQEDTRTLRLKRPAWADILARTSGDPV